MAMFLKEKLILKVQIDQKYSVDIVNVCCSWKQQQFF